MLIEARKHFEEHGNAIEKVLIPFLWPGKGIVVVSVGRWWRE